MENAEVAAVLDEIADLLEIVKEREFRIRSYRMAARTVGDLGQRVEELDASGRDLTKLPNIGKSTAQKIHELVTTGHCRRLDALREKMPPELTTLLRVLHLGAKTVARLYREQAVQELVAYPPVEDVVGKGLERVTVRTRSGL